MKELILTFTILLSTLSFAQEKKGLVPSSGKLNVVNLSDEENRNKPSLQQMVENMYNDAVAVLENGKVLYKSGEFLVYVFNKRTNDSQLIESKDLNQINVEDIKSFKFSKDASHVALFGSKVESTGMVWIELK